MNKIILIGRLVRDPELSTTTSGKSVCRFALAVQRRFTNQSGEREADFINITVWGVAGENCHKYLKKGVQCGVVGRLQITSSEQDGTKRYYTDVVAEEVEFLSTKNSNSDDYEKQDKSQVSELEPIEDDTLPF